MLDSTTKRRIDTARDILVGKVPDPKSQVEQITIALIYKFMDDMDAQAEELGGKRTFFAGDFQRFGWAKLRRSGLGGHETLNLYAEAITRMPENPGIPPLFRDIFKNAYLPYRDPETLRAFLKVIDEFEYDHSERLGDAFEYLLSVLGSQGQAGQFRTPRHIIDFIVAIVDPKKNETVLDPACGTAGFLISAYKHIMRANSSPAAVAKNGGDGEAALHSSKIPAAKGDLLSPDERKKLAENFRGYDISPDMVRLSLVNMYLHGFADPHVHEYDTLTSDDRWSEFADVILANPPFMSPKGGIKPHNRFSVQSKRSEVLFVDYMAEHLTPNGRAGIIVPEGIIFQSQTAYKKLRKMLVEQYLVAVVSLPAGVFNPYAGVKTSILILDKSLAKQSDTVGFFKVDNDGFNLGAQRRPIDKNDLPQVLADVNEYLRRLRAKKSVAAEDFTPTRGLIVAKEKIAASGGGDFNLSGERYRVSVARSHAFPHVTLDEICTINPPKSEGLSLPPETEVSFVPMSDLGENRMTFTPKLTKRIDEVGTSYTYFADGDVLVAKVTPCFENGKAGIARDLTNGVGFGSSEFYVLRPSDRVLAEFVYFCVTHRQFRDPAIEQMTGTGGLQRVPKRYVEQFEIPLPPLEVQREIVAEIEAYQKVIDGARAVLDHYRPHIPIQPDWPMATFADACAEIKTGPFGSLLHQADYVVHGVPVVNPQDILDGEIVTAKIKYVAPDTRDRLSEFTIKARDIVIGRRGEMGRCAIATKEMEGWLCGTGCCVIRPSEACDVRFLSLHLQSTSSIAFLEQHSVGVTIKNLNHRILANLPIPLPPLETQRSIVSEIEAERRLVESNRELIARMEAKFAATLARIWGEEPQGAAKAGDVAAKQSATRVQSGKNRAAITSRLVRSAGSGPHKRNIGVTLAEKGVFFVEHVVGIDCESRWRKDRLGPHDPQGRAAAEDVAANLNWFTVAKKSKDEKRPIQAGHAINDGCTYFKTIAGDAWSAAEKLIKKIVSWTTEEAELYATLYAVWNDLIVDSREPTLSGKAELVTDDSIVKGFFNWHESKRERFTEAKARAGLRKLRSMGLEPRGTKRAIATD